MYSTKYTKSAVDNVEQQLKEIRDGLPSRAVTQIYQGYYPETDLYPDLDQYGMLLLV